MLRTASSLLLALTLACGGSSTGDDFDPAEPAVVVYLGEELAPAVRDRFLAHLEAVADRPVIENPTSIPGGSLVLSVGDTDLGREIISRSELDALGSEGFVVRTGSVGSTTVLAADGNPADDGFGLGSRGDHYAAYAILDELGYSFLHPLEPLRPADLPAEAPEVDISEKPHWEVRGMQIHTMHPLELTNVLNGWGETGHADGRGWEAMLPEWELAVEWFIANRQNRVQWVLLWAKSWEDFGESTTRQNRLARVVEIGHSYGLGVGIDVPISLKQQASFHLIHDEDGELADQLDEMRTRLDWVLAAGFDYFSTENGTSEFTHVEDTRMMAWMNELVRHLDEAHDGMQAYLKAHTSRGQSAESYDHPETGEALNINFLTYYADPRLGVMPHTVQHYALDDPAPTYGNQDFGFMRDYLQLEVGRRKVVWHPETAYWVSFDIDVPLFLPIYAERRFHDLRLLAEDETEGRMGRGEHAGGRMDGQMVFSSGWEWGYWLGDVVAARASWNPRLDIADEREAFAALLGDVLDPAGDASSDLSELIIDIIDHQQDLLIEGRIGGQAPSEIALRNGQAYMQGQETWDEIAKLAGLITGPVDTQPRKLGLIDMRNPLSAGPIYKVEIDPLLAEMERAFGTHAEQMDALRTRVDPTFQSVMDELADSTRMNALRATQVHNLYDYVDSDDQDKLAEARQALDQAASLVAERERHYRVDPERIAGWGENPTVYDFGYLWTARTLFYWWRDEGKAFDAPISPCYMNIISPATTGFGEGVLADAASLAQDVLDELGLGAISTCLDAPDLEPSYPQPGVRP